MTLSRRVGDRGGSPKCSGAAVHLVKTASAMTMQLRPWTRAWTFGGSLPILRALVALLGDHLAHFGAHGLLVGGGVCRWQANAERRQPTAGTAADREAGGGRSPPRFISRTLQHTPMS